MKRLLKHSLLTTVLAVAPSLLAFQHQALAQGSGGADSGSNVRANQLGYLPGGPKNATLITEATGSLPWSLKDASGEVVAEGQTEPRGEDPSAGLNVHSIAFSDYKGNGEGYVLEVDGEMSHPFTIGNDIYAKLRYDTKTFFYTNRSGVAIDDALAPGYGRAAGHIGIGPNQGDTAVPCQDLDDDSQKLFDEPWTCEGTRDVTGGWYDAGDHGKYTVNGSISVAQLMQEYERTLWASTAQSGALDDETLSIPEVGNGVPDLLDEVRWQLEWLLKMQVPQGEPLAGMANHKVADVDWTGLPTDPAADPKRRVLYRPSTAATFDLAAVTAQGARVFEPFDAAFAETLLTAARTAYDAAMTEPVLLAPAPNAELDSNPGSGPYNDEKIEDEHYWAASQLYLTTSDDDYLQAVLDSPVHEANIFTRQGFAWNDVAALGRMDLATLPNKLPDRERVQQSVIDGATGYLEDQASQPFGQTYAPEDANYVWGSNSQILNNMQVVATAYDLTGERRFLDGVLEGMDYLLGRNAMNMSYITGYGDVFVTNQHSRWYAESLDDSLPPPPDGTVSGGPNSSAVQTGDPVAVANLEGCVGQFCFIDDIGSWSTNEITINWNAPMSWIASFVADQVDVE